MKPSLFYKSVGVLLLAILCIACSSQQRMQNSLKRVFKTDTLFKRYHVGFDLFDLAHQKHVYQYHADKYFIPASNTKLYTFYAALKVLKDSVPGLRYQVTGDSLVFWGTGDPSFLHSVLKGSHAYQFLKQSDKKLYYSPTRYTGKFYGLGWSWDDYNDYYQAEINELPLMDNVINIKAGPNGQLILSPRAFEACLQRDTATGHEFLVQRDFNQNEFHYPNLKVPSDYKQQVPYKVSVTQTLNLLQDTLKREVGLVYKTMPSYAKTIYNSPTDSVLKAMMLPSDNFIAEHLLLTFADQLGLEMNAKIVIEHIKKAYLQQLPDEPKWVDGSGLSRMNLFTPRATVKLLQLIEKEFPDRHKLFELLPAGGQSGTLKNAYPKTDSPFVFGKTGTLSNNHNQSGYVVTKKGNVYAFSLMNNNFLYPTATIRKKIAEIITQVHEKL